MKRISHICALAWSVAIVLSFASHASVHAAQGATKKAPAQDEKRLEQLLLELQRLPPAAWKARKQALTRRIADHRARAKKLRDDAAMHARAAARVAEELERLEQMRGLVKSDAPSSGKENGAKAVPQKTVKAKSAAASTARPMTAKSTAAKPKTSKPKTTKPKAAKPKAAKPKTSIPKASTAKAKNPGSVAAAGPIYDFATHVQPIFEESCQVCHDAGDAASGLDLSTLAATLEGGSSGKVVVPGNPDGSRLFRLVAHLEKPFMPEDADALSKGQLGVLRRWIELGAPADAKSARAAAKRLLAVRAAAAAKAAAAKKTADSVLRSPLPRSWPKHAAVALRRPAPLRAIAASPGAQLLALGVGDRVHMLATKGALDANARRLGVLAPEIGRIESMRFSPDGRLLLVAGGQAGKSGRAAVFDVASGRRVASPGRNRDSFLTADLRTDGVSVVAGASKRVTIHDADGRERLAYMHKDWVLRARFSPDGKLVASVDRKGRLLVYGLRKGRPMAQVDVRGGAAQSLAWTRDSKRVVVVVGDGTLRQFDVKSGREAGASRFHRVTGLALERATNGGFISLGRDGSVVVADTGMRPRANLLAKTSLAASLAIDADGARVFVGSLDGRLYELELGGKRRVRVHQPTQAVPSAVPDRTTSSAASSRASAR